MLENELRDGAVFVNKNGDVFVKIDEKSCAFLGNIQKSKTDFSLFFPIVGGNEVEVLGTLDIINQINNEHVN